MKGVYKVLYQKNLLNVKTGEGFCYKYIMLFKTFLTFTIIVVSAVVVCSILMVKVISWILIITVLLWRTIRLMQPFYCFFLCESLWQTFNVIIYIIEQKENGKSPCKRKYGIWCSNWQLDCPKICLVLPKM